MSINYNDCINLLYPSPQKTPRPKDNLRRKLASFSILFNKEAKFSTGLKSGDDFGYSINLSACVP